MFKSHRREFFSLSCFQIQNTSQKGAIIMTVITVATARIRANKKRRITTINLVIGFECVWVVE